MMIYCLINDIINEERKSCTKEMWVKKTSIIFICDEFKAIMQLWKIVVIVQWYWIVLLVQIGLPEENCSHNLQNCKNFENSIFELNSPPQRKNYTR